jgi:hypothetical protein
MSSRTWRLGAALLAVLAVLGTCAGLPGPRHALLRAAGRTLVRSDPLRHADVIVIAADADGAGVLEAVELVRAGLADRVAVFEDPPDPIDREFLRRGITYYDAAAVALHQLEDLGVSNVETIARPVAGTEDEGAVLPGWCDGRGWRTVLFVSTADHSRRARRVLHRAMQGHPTTVLVQYSHFSAFDPDRWWQSRLGVRTEIVEAEKLLLDLVRHP